MLALQLQVHISKAASLAFTPNRIRHTRLSDSSEALHDRTAVRILDEAGLDRHQQRFLYIFGKFLESARKRPGFDKYHTEVYTT